MARPQTIYPTAEERNELDLVTWAVDRPMPQVGRIILRDGVKSSLAEINRGDPPGAGK
jgi:hypothetical protein